MPTKKRKSGAKRRTARASKAPFLKVTSPRHFHELKKMMSSAKIMFVYIGEPWCGFCNKFEPDFKEMVRNKKRNMAAVSILGSQLSASPLGSMVKADGYPTVAIVAPKQNTSFNLPSREPTVIRTVTENAPALTPPEEVAEEVSTVMENSLNNLLNRSRSQEATGSRPIAANNMANYTGNNMGNNKSRSKSATLFEETDERDIERPPSRFTPVTVDTNPPPLSVEKTEEEYLKARKPASDITMEQLGGGRRNRSLWDTLYGR